ncbi:MAG: DUF418 domain-containing protein [Planctomycetota bacterium]|nr:DUF418 domain-containing protein [Planctomycetota bacterium]
MTEHAAPAQSSDRIVSLDVLRGVAVLGILVMNIQAYSMPIAAYMNPTAYGDLTGINWWVWCVGHVIADQKFISIFSMLFGAGIYLFAERAFARTGRSAGLHYRRTFWLLLIGLVHAHVLWFGDILVPYALCACIIYPLRNMKPRAMLILAMVLLAIPAGLGVMFGMTIPYWEAADVAALQEDWAPPAAAIDSNLATYRGSFLEQFPKRSEAATGMETFVFLLNFCWQVSGMMLLGILLYRSGALLASKSATFYRRMFTLGMAIGLPLTLFGIYENSAAGYAVEYSFFLGSQWNYGSSIALALAYVALVMLLVQSGAIRSFQQRLAALGQMAFTNYLMQTALCTTLFYGQFFGLGYYGSFERWQQALVVIAVWILQLWYSPLWLARFRFGPMEWLWRSLTYWQRQPMRR